MIRWLRGLFRRSVQDDPTTRAAVMEAGGSHLSRKED